MISYNSMTGPCWKYAAQVNHCCALHDNCYDLQLGRENCDQNFCDCLKRATAPDTCAATELKCLAIKKVGQQAYFDAASYEEPPSFVKIVPHIDGVENDFLLLYQECPQVMLTIKSCSLIANICMKNEEENCEQNLSECVQQAADLQNSQQCREASHQAQMSLTRVNHCCAIHDNCYGLQLGRENCDQNFCDCLLRATAPDTCVATALKCLATIEGGEEAYLNSATYQEQLDFVKIVPNIDGIEKEFLLLYQECPLVMETIKSCSLLTNICINNEEENCEHRLSECVQQAADLQNSQQCREATHQAQQSLSSHQLLAGDERFVRFWVRTAKCGAKSVAI
nr:Phospholipase A2-like protein [Haemonchus contortus]